MFEFFSKAGFNQKKIDVSATGIKKIIAHLYAFVVILFSEKTSVYISLNSNNGLILNVLLVLAARLKNSNLYLHYHAYDHIRRRSKVLYWLTKLAGKRACHIVLGQTMANDLQKSVGFQLDTFVLNNSKLIEQNKFHAQPKESVIRLGHLSNLTKEKGLTATIDTAIYLKNYFSIELHLAGPATSEYVNDEIQRAKAAFGESLKYLGPLYGQDKDQFYASIDYFIFPSQYKNEAEPLVVLEALSAGVPVIASNIGCISDDIDSTGGISLSMDENFKPKVKHYLSQIEHENKYFQASINAKNRFLELLMTSQDQLELLVERMRKD
ncbi:glycosyltransferase family 4 protein [Acinetobacter sp. UBA3025]|nr:glycosyltransferase family 4 protein [Acinetobacter sp. UBA3025]